MKRIIAERACFRAAEEWVRRRDSGAASARVPDPSRGAGAGREQPGVLISSSFLFFSFLFCVCV